MKALRITIILTSILFFNSCTKDVPAPKIIYVKNEYPKQRFLYSIKPYKITDSYVIDDIYIAVNKKQLSKASETSRLLRKQTIFYENQVKEYNKKFINSTEKSIENN